MLDKRMRTGLTKLVEAQQNVDELKKELVVKEQEMQVATEAAEKVLDIVMAASETANKIKEEATFVKDKAEKLVEIISADQQEAEKKLLAAKPALDAAEAALLVIFQEYNFFFPNFKFQTIKAADIATVRKLGKPPYLITLIMDAVIIYFKRKIEPVRSDFEKKFLEASWAESLRVMADTKFLSKLQEYPKDSINAEIVDLLQPYFEYPTYTYEAAKVACGNVAGLISWTIAMASFFEVNREVLPLKVSQKSDVIKL